MKTITINTLLLAAFTILFSSCMKEGHFCIKGNGGTTSMNIDMDDFKGISLEISADVEIIAGDVQEVIIEGEYNIIENIKTRVRNDIWHIDYENCVRNSKPVRIYITMPELDYAYISGSGDIETFGEFDETDELKLKISGSGNMDLAVDANLVDAKISGSGNIKLTTYANSVDTKISGSGDITFFGSTNWLGVDISGSGDIHAYGLNTKECDLDVSGSGQAELDIENKLDIRISGSGDVYYQGTPAISTHISGSGDLHNVN